MIDSCASSCDCVYRNVFVDDPLWIWAKIGFVVLVYVGPVAHTSSVFCYLYSWLAHNDVSMHVGVWYRCHTLKVSTKTTCCISSHRSQWSNLGLDIPSKCWLKKLSVDTLCLASLEFWCIFLYVIMILPLQIVSKLQYLIVQKHKIADCVHQRLRLNLPWQHGAQMPLQNSPRCKLNSGGKK